jgi:RecQ mediated genome instability protein
LPLRRILFIVNRNVMSLQTQVLAHFASKQLHLSNTYISALVNSIHPLPITVSPALLANFHTSFLNSSLKQSASPQSFLPPSVPNQHGVSISGPTLVQIIHVQDIGTSRLAQLEALEKSITEAGPQGRRVVDLPADEEADDNPMANGTNEGLSVGKSICKVLLEDGRGERVYGMEVKPIEGIKVGMSLGCKVCLPMSSDLTVVVVN